MTQTHRDAFGSLHPVTAFSFLCVEIAFLVASSNPIFQGIGIVGALLYAGIGLQKRLRALLLSWFPIVALTLLINPLFSHQGATILGYFRDGNPFTLESVLYGGGMGLLVFSMLTWFVVWNHTMTADKWIQLFGTLLPHTGLLLSMVLRFVPKLQRQQRRLRLAQPHSRAGKRFSMLVTWGLETSVDTADSMAARGYGLHHRRIYKRYRFRRADGMFLLVTAVLSLFLIYLLSTQGLVFYYYPVVVVSGRPVLMELGYVAFGILSLLPVGYEWEERRKWNYLRSKI